MKFSKKIILTSMMLAFSAFNAYAAEGLCTSEQGIENVSIVFNKTLPVRIKEGQSIDEANWDFGSWPYFYALCNGPDATYRFVTTTTRINAPEGHAPGWYKLNEYLDFTISSNVIHHYDPGNTYYLTPFTNMRTNGAYIDKMEQSSLNPKIQLIYVANGSIKLYLKKAFVGTQTFTLPGILSYWVGVSTTGDQNVPIGATNQVERLNISGSITIPGYCDFSADQVTDVDFGNIAAPDIASKGDSTNSKRVNFDVECSADSGAKVQIKLTGDADSSDSSVLKTNLNNVGVKIYDNENKAINVNGGILPITLDAASGTGSTYITAFPYHTDDANPEIGSFSAQLTANVTVD